MYILNRLQKTEQFIVVWFLVFVFLILLVITTRYYSQENVVANNNIKIIELQKQLDMKSDIEILEEAALSNARYAKSRLVDIIEYKKAISKLESLYESELLTQRCYESQIDRKINWFEYNINYCKDKLNILKFKSKKY